MDGEAQPDVIETLDALQARHRKELKDLTGKITALKKSVGGNKQKKKDVQVQAALMEKELDDRHAQERTAIEQLQQQHAEMDTVEQQPSNETDDAHVSAITDDLKNVSVTPEERKKKPNKAQLRKQRKVAEFEAMRRVAAEEAANMPNQKEVEDSAIAEMLVPLGLQIKQIAPDGHCMYNAVAHQLSVRAGDDNKTYKDIRSLAADFLRTHTDDFIPFLVNKNGDMLNPDEYQAYCDGVEKTADWGGQTELQAIARALKRPIHIVQAGSPTLTVGEEFTSEPLYVSYHRHAYGLGAHYNSLLPA